PQFWRARQCCAHPRSPEVRSMRMQLADIAKSYGAQVVLDDVSLTIGPRARIGLVGPDGVGKPTLRRIVVGAESPDRGGVVRAPQAHTIGYLEQERRAV